MQVGSYKFHRRALMALNQLTADERARVLETLAGLVETPVAQWLAPQARRLPGESPLYLVRIDDSLRAIVRAADGQEPEVMDIAHRETLEFFAKNGGNSDH